MARTVVKDKVNIYKYPKSLKTVEASSLTLGDLHGNGVKFLFFLFQYQIIKFKAEVVNPKQRYKDMATDYARCYEITQIYKEFYLAREKVDEYAESSARLKVLNSRNGRNPIEEGELEQLEDLNLDGLQRTHDDLFEKVQGFKSELGLIVERFRVFIVQLDVNQNQILIRLLGDELADRGANDYLILKIIEFLNLNQVKMNILISNHGNEFLFAYEAWFYQSPYVLSRILTTQTVSWLGLQFLLEENLIEPKEVSSIVEAYYKPNLKVLDYDIDEQAGLMLFSHAPVKLKIVRILADYFGLDEVLYTQENSALHIDQINLELQKILKRHEFCEHLNADGIRNLGHMSPEQIRMKPLLYVTSNRWTSLKDTLKARPEIHSVASYSYSHGHESYKGFKNFAHIHSFDTGCGKGEITDENKSLTVLATKVGLLYEEISTPGDKKDTFSSRGAVNLLIRLRMGVTGPPPKVKLQAPIEEAAPSEAMVVQESGESARPNSTRFFQECMAVRVAELGLASQKTLSPMPYSVKEKTAEGKEDAHILGYENTF